MKKKKKNSREQGMKAFQRKRRRRRSGRAWLITNHWKALRMKNQWSRGGGAERSDRPPVRKTLYAREAPGRRPGWMWFVVGPIFRVTLWQTCFGRGPSVSPWNGFDWVFARGNRVFMNKMLRQSFIDSWLRKMCVIANQSVGVDCSCMIRYAYV